MAGGDAVPQNQQDRMKRKETVALHHIDYPGPMRFLAVHVVGHLFQRTVRPDGVEVPNGSAAADGDRFRNHRRACDQTISEPRRTGHTRQHRSSLGQFAFDASSTIRPYIGGGRFEPDPIRQFGQQVVGTSNGGARQCLGPFSGRSRGRRIVSPARDHGRPKGRYARA